MTKLINPMLKLMFNYFNKYISVVNFCIKIPQPELQNDFRTQNKLNFKKIILNSLFSLFFQVGKLQVKKKNKKFSRRNFPFINKRGNKKR